MFRLQLKPGATTQVTDWRSPDALTDGVNFRLLALRQPESFAVIRGWKAWSAAISVR